jgi:hypothetical protein
MEMSKQVIGVLALAAAVLAGITWVSQSQARSTALPSPARPLALTSSRRRNAPRATERRTSIMRKFVLFALFELMMVNCIAFFAIGAYLGGYALLGKISDGHAYLGSRGHLTEVGGDVFLYSLWHGRSVFITLPLAIVFLVMWTRVARKQPAPPVVNSDSARSRS